MAISMVYITFRDKKEAKKIASILVKEKLVACANLFGVGSLFVLKRKLKSGGEFVAVCKTKPALLPRIQARVKELHSYEVPCILSWAVDSNKEFENWVFSSTGNLF